MVCTAEPERSTGRPRRPSFNGADVVIEASFWPAPIVLTAALAWLAGRRQPDRSLAQRLVVGALSMPLPLIADVGHAFAHTASARAAGAPMDRIVLSAAMPRTLYDDNEVSPRIHKLRASGGPLYSVAGLLLSMLWRRGASTGSLGRELADLSCASHAFILVGGLAPLPFVDGGTILKWTLVERGHDPEMADALVRRASLALGAALLGGASLLALLGRRVAGVLAALAGVAAVAAGKGWLR